MNTTVLIALYAAVLSTLMLGLRIHDWLQSRRPLTISADFKRVRRTVDVSQIQVRIANTSSQPVQIERVAVVCVFKFGMRELVSSIQEFSRFRLGNANLNFSMTEDAVLQPGQVIYGTFSIDADIFEQARRKIERFRRFVAVVYRRFRVPGARTIARIFGTYLTQRATIKLLVRHALSEDREMVVIMPKQKAFRGD